MNRKLGLLVSVPFSRLYIEPTEVKEKIPIDFNWLGIRPSTTNMLCDLSALSLLPISGAQLWFSPSERI